MMRRVLTLSAVGVVLGLLVPGFARAQYGTSSTTAPPTTTTTASVAGVTVTTPPLPITVPTVPGVTTTSIKISPSAINVQDLLSGNFAAVVAQLRGRERDEAAQRIADLIEEILASAGPAGEVTIVGGATLELGGDPNVPVTFSFSADGYAANAVVTFILESTPVLLGTATATEGGIVSGAFEVPRDLEPGDHTISAVGSGPDGEPVVNTETIQVPEPPSDDEETATEQAAPADEDDGGTGPLLWILLGVLATVALIMIFAAMGPKTKTAPSETES